MSISPADLLAAIVDSSEDAIVSKDLNGTVTSWNRAASTLFGFSAAEMVGQSITRIIPADRMAEEEFVLSRVRAGLRVDHFETVRQRKDGSLIDVSLTVSPVRDASGAIIGASKIARDIREARTLRQALEEASRSKDELFAMLGHELRNPLSPILTALDLMRLKGMQGMERERALIERQVRHVVSLVDDLLDVSRIRTGKLQLKKQRIDLMEAVTKAIEAASPLLEQRHHRLEIETGDGPPVIVDADPNRLEQIGANLLTNAAKYTEAGGVIHVRVVREHGDAVFSVTDSGIGIAPEMLPRVFEAFVQEHQALDRAQGGLGLGLTVVRSLAELHGGRVAAFSEGLGKGSTFEVRLPLATGTAEELRAPEPLALETARNHWRVLVVDDNEDYAELMADFLRRAGYTTEAAFNAPSALAAADKLRPHVAFIDIGLPGMDGYELGAHLRQMPLLGRLRVIAVTGYSHESARRRSEEAGFERHLVKPVDVHALQAIIEEVMAG